MPVEFQIQPRTRFRYRFRSRVIDRQGNMEKEPYQNITGTGDITSVLFGKRQARPCSGRRGPVKAVLTFS